MMNNINFKGYTNIISAYNIPVDNMKVTYIAMKLNDDGEYKDLTKFKEIRKALKYPNGLENEDILTLTYMTDNRTEDIYIGDRGICWGEQLLYAKENYVPGFLNEKEYKNIEAIHLKIYTFLANIIQRMSYDKFENEDEGMKSVIKGIFTNLTRIHKGGFLLFDSHDAFELTSIGALKQYKFQNIARKLNRKIMETMTEFFR